MKNFIPENPLVNRLLAVLCFAMAVSFGAGFFQQFPRGDDTGLTVGLGLLVLTWVFVRASTRQSADTNEEI